MKTIKGSYQVKAAAVDLDTKLDEGLFHKSTGSWMSRLTNRVNISLTQGNYTWVSVSSSDYVDLAESLVRVASGKELKSKIPALLKLHGKIEVPAVYRVHKLMDPEKIYQLKTIQDNNHRRRGE